MSQSTKATSFPPPPTTTINWKDPEKLRKVHEVLGHVESTYHRSTGEWTPLKFVKDPYVRIHGLAPGINYGQHALEGLKSFRMPDGNVAVFRPDANAKRLQHSAHILNMPPVPTDLFVNACRAVVTRNAEYVPPHETGWALYCRPTILASGPQFPPGFPDECRFSVFVLPSPTAHLPGALPDPIRALILDEFDRAAPRGTGTSKAGGNYAGGLRWSSKAAAEGFGITLHLDSQRHEYVDEFSLCGFLGVLHDRSGDSEEQVTIVVPESPCAIESFTSDTAQQVARSFGWKVVRRPVAYVELPDFSEVIGAGTAMGLVPIRSITRRPEPGMTQLDPATPRVQRADDGSSETLHYIPDEQKEGGPVFQRLVKRVRAIQLGTAEDEFGWRFQVTETDAELAQEE